MVSSTQGSVLVRSGQVTEAHGIVLTVRFHNGDVRTYQIKPDEAFRAGDKVMITTGAGGTRITHYTEAGNY